MKKTGISSALTFGLAIACVSIVPPSVLSPLYAQTTISGDIAGTVTDATGAAVPGATVTVTSVTEGSVKTATSTGSGAYRIPLLKPGAYKISIVAPGFQTREETVTVSTGAVAGGDIKLAVGQASTVVEVTDQAPLLQTDDAQLSTTFNLQQIQDLPNPGGDITYYAQTAPGVVMNTGGGYGNFSVFGLPGTSNNFTVNGEQENDPFLNLNNSGPTNLLLGQNDISTVSVITSAYGPEFGSFGGAQINETSRSGTNKFHGDASYYYSGRALTANNWFTKENQVANGLPSANPFSINNQWSAAIGGPIVKDKTFFFADYEGIRFITANPQTVFVPTAAYQDYILGPTRNCDPQSSLAQYGAAGECNFYKSIFNLFNTAPNANRATAVAGGPTLPTTPIQGAGGPAAVDPGANIINSYVATPSLFAKEMLVTGRVDQVLGAHDTIFAHFKYDVGDQPTYVDPINTAFNATSHQPEEEGQLVETHIFGPNLVNQALATVAHYAAPFVLANQTAATNLLPFGSLIFAEGFFNAIGEGYAFPQGRNATQYQFADDVSYTIRKHSIKVGYAFKKDLITNLDTGIYTHPLVEVLEAPGDQDFEAGTAFLYRQTFPNNLSNPNNLYTEGFYAADTYKASDKLTATLGIRFEHNSNPVCPHNCFSRLNQNLSSFIGTTAATNIATPYNSVIAYNLGKAFNSFQNISYEPRFEVSYAVRKNTLLRGGFGIFSDVFPGQVADELLRNIPQDPRFQVQFATLQPNAAGSGAQLTAQSNQVFKSGATTNFFNGGSYSSLRAVAPGFVRPNIATADSSVKFPTYEEYSLQLEQQMGRNTVLQLTYAGNHGYHEPVVATNSNAFFAGNGAGAPFLANGFGGLPTARPFSNFGQVTNLQSTASSNYNGGVISLIHHTKLVNAQINYTYSHSLDQISNGGFLGFSTSAITGPLAPNTLQYNYGNSDYDVRHSLNGNYLVNVPSYGTGLVKSLTGGFTVAGTVFYRAGLPYTVTDSNTSNLFGGNYSGGVPALVRPGVSRTCNGHQAAITGCFANPAADFTDPTSFIPGQRNAFYGPHYFNTDLTVNKGFALPSHESIKFIIGVNAYNVLNHPNFINPSSDIGNGGVVTTGGGGNGLGPNFSQNLGRSFGTASVPTSIYGAGLGGDASIRILQLHAKVSF